MFTIRRISLFLVLLCSLLGMATLASAQGYALTMQLAGALYDTNLSTGYLPTGGGFPYVEANLTNTTANQLFLTDMSVLIASGGDTINTDPHSLSRLYENLQLIRQYVLKGDQWFWEPVVYGIGYSWQPYDYYQGGGVITQPPGWYLDYGGANAVVIYPNSTLSETATNNSCLFYLNDGDGPSITIIVTIYGGTTSTSHDLLLSQTFTMVRGTCNVVSDASTYSFPQMGGTVAVTGTGRTIQHNAPEGNLIDLYTLSLPTGVTLANTPPALVTPTYFGISLTTFQPENDPVTGQPDGYYFQSYPASHPLFTLNIPPGTSAFTTNLTFYSSIDNGATNRGGSNAIHFVPSTMDVSGTVKLANATASHTVTAVLRPTDSSAATTYTVTVPPSGAFALSQVPTKNYTLWVKSPKWLAKSIPFDLSQGVAPTINLTLSGGDANNDNVVNTSDFNILIGEFGSNVTTPGYDGSADFNDDGSVDTLDFNILIGSFGESGDP